MSTDKDNQDAIQSCVDWLRNTYDADARPVYPSAVTYSLGGTTRTEHDPSAEFIAGTVARTAGQQRVPPGDLTDEEAEEWLKGYDA